MKRKSHVSLKHIVSTRQKQKVLIWSSISLSTIALGADAIGSNAGLKKEIHNKHMHTHTGRDHLNICSLFVFEACLLDMFALGLYLANCGLDSSLGAIETLLQRNDQGECCY